MNSSTTNPHGYPLSHRPEKPDLSSHYSLIRLGDPILIIRHREGNQRPYMTVAIKSLDADAPLDTQHEVIIPTPRHAIEDADGLRLVKGDIRIDVTEILHSDTLIYIGASEIRRWFFGDLVPSEENHLLEKQEPGIVKFVKLMRLVDGNIDDPDLKEAVGRYYNARAREVADHFYANSWDESTLRTVRGLLDELRTLSPSNEAVANGVMLMIDLRFKAFLELIERETGTAT